MAMPIRPTLRELRESVLLRIGMSPDGGAAARAAAQVDERIREAQEYIHLNLDFTHLWTRRAVPLTVGVTDYDWPDDVEVGDLRRVVAARNDGYEIELASGLNTYERNSAYWNGSTSAAPQDTWNAPQLWTIENQIIKIAPAPDEYWTQLIFEAFIAPTPLVSDEDRCAVNGEALKKLAEALLKTHFGMPGAQEAKQAFNDFIEDLRTKQGDGEGFQLGGRQSARLAPDRRNRLGGYGMMATGPYPFGGPFFGRW